MGSGPTTPNYLYKLAGAISDCPILGCTHVPLLLDVKRETVGAGDRVLDGALWAARETRDMLASLDARAPLAAAGRGRDAA